MLTEQAAPLKPLDEPYMVPFLLFVCVVNKRTGRGPTVAEAYEHLGWRNRDSYANWYRLLKLTRRGLVLGSGERSMHLSEAGVRHLKLALREARARHERRSEGR